MTKPPAVRSILDSIDFRLLPHIMDKLEILRETGAIFMVTPEVGKQINNYGDSFLAQYQEPTNEFLRANLVQTKLPFPVVGIEWLLINDDKRAQHAPYIRQFHIAADESGEQGACHFYNAFQVHMDAQGNIFGLTQMPILCIDEKQAIGVPVTSAPLSEKVVQITEANLFAGVYMALGLINSKTGITRTAVPRAFPPSHYGAKKRKLYTRSPFTVVSLSEVETVSPEGVVSERKDIAAHLVRGHFKRKKHGTYWWSPHTRGHGPLQRRDAYVVTE